MVFERFQVPESNLEKGNTNYRTRVSICKTNPAIYNCFELYQKMMCHRNKTYFKLHSAYLSPIRGIAIHIYLPTAAIKRTGSFTQG